MFIPLNWNINYLFKCELSIGRRGYNFIPIKSPNIYVSLKRYKVNRTSVNGYVLIEKCVNRLMYMNINFHQLKLRLIEIEYPWHMTSVKVSNQLHFVPWERACIISLDQNSTSVKFDVTVCFQFPYWLGVVIWQLKFQCNVSFVS